MSAQDRNDYLRDLAAPLRDGRTIAQIEAGIREREMQTLRWLEEKPWLAGRDLADTTAACLRAINESLAREAADRESSR
jgi:hypothetical protein